MGTFLMLLECPHWVGFNEGDLEISKPKGARDIEFEVVFYL